MIICLKPNSTQLNVTFSILNCKHYNHFLTKYVVYGGMMKTNLISTASFAYLRSNVSHLLNCMVLKHLCSLSLLITVYRGDHAK